MGLKSTTVCLGYQQITSLSAATALTVPSGATLAVIVAEAQAVRWRDDGVAPTATVGMPVGTYVPLIYDGDLSRIRFIEQTASAKINVSYYA
jgi:ABC-type nickel/cobalt efflux system permease component RcnA